jgi:hypothetical protein
MEPCDSFQIMSALPRTVYGVRFMTADAAARVAFGLSAITGNGRILSDSMNWWKRLPNSPNGPTAIGMKTLFVSSISPMTSSADSVLFLIGFVPPVHLAIFFSPSLKRKSVSLH